MNPDNLLLHQFQVSPFAAKVRRGLRYKGLDFRVRNYSLAEAGTIRKTISPTGKTPVLEHQGRLIVDSTDILRYLEERFPQPSLYPADARQRAQALIIEDWSDESLFFYDLTMRSWPKNIDWLRRDILSHDSGWNKRLFSRLMPKVIGKITQPQGLGRKDPEVVTAEVDRLFSAVDDLLADGDWLVGDALSVADIAVVAMCTVLDRAEEAAALMRSRPALMAWRARVDALTFPPGTDPADYAIT